MSNHPVRPPLGAHRPTVGGLHTAWASADEIGAEVMQILTSSPQQWAARRLDEAALAAWSVARADAVCRRVVAHSAYLLNLASPKPETHERSVAAFTAELQRCQALGLEGVVLHPGAHTGDGEEAGLERIAASLRAIYDAHPELTVPTLLESTAGSGTHLGYRLEHLAWLLAAIDRPGRIAVCLDTCHLHAAGYDQGSPAAVQAFIDEFDAVVGLEYLALVHLNDSKTAVGSRVDRHERIGDGHLGRASFATWLRDERLRQVPMAVETPGLENHGEELVLLRALAAGEEVDDG